MPNQNIGEAICQAVDTIVSKRLEGIQYDTTILCTIVDNSRKHDGVYTVTNNGSTQFDAYSQVTTYAIGNSVYVKIPNGDWSQQKLILAKKVDKDNEPFTYQHPFGSLVNMTNNLIDCNIPLKETGLIANYPGKEYITLWTYNLQNDEALYHSEGIDFSAYSRLGIQAGFQSWLSPFYLDNVQHQVVKGEYGLRLVVHTIGEANSEEEGKEARYIIELNQSDMNGNPYNFQDFYLQEKVVDISEIGRILSMELQFYQNPGSFASSSGTALPYQDFLGNLIEPNLWVNDIVISLGYDIGEFDDELVKIYTIDSPTYTATAYPATENHKQLQLRWIHKVDEDTCENITSQSNLDYEVRWYRYSRGRASADEYAGIEWAPLMRQRKLETGYWQYIIEDEDWKKYNESAAGGFNRNGGFFSSWLLPNIHAQREEIKAIILYDGKVYKSNILGFENEEEVVNAPTVSVVSDLSIVCEDNTYGNYFIYKQNNQLLDASQGQVERRLIPYMKDVSGTPQIVTKADSIEWVIPIENTMINCDSSMWGNDFYEDDLGRIHIIRHGYAADGHPEPDIMENNNDQRYRIRSYYVQGYNNNTIQCIVTVDGTAYYAAKELSFGPAGTTGTDYTFVLDFNDNKTGLTIGSEDAVVVSARLYDYNNKEVDISNEKITWSWKTSDGLIGNQNLDNNSIELYLIGNQTQVANYNYNILKASMEYTDYALEAYLPIPIKTSDIDFIAGPTQVLYDSSGSISDAYFSPYQGYKNSQILEQEIVWEIRLGDETDAHYAPTITNYKGQYRLDPLSFYVEDACEKVCVLAYDGNKIIWSQPLLIMQNRYPMAMVNKWNGSLDVGSTDPGTILAPRLVAGRKESDNTFSGVTLGDWKSANAESSLTSGTGLFGFHHGEQSYGFRDDGTAFIGKSGAGRITFDGEEGIIESASYAENEGMSINLRDGNIAAHNFTLTAKNPEEESKRIYLSTQAEINPLQLGDKFKVAWDGSIASTGGIIGGWTINDSTLTGGSTTLNSDGTITANKLIANTSGTIGGWTIENGRIYSGSMEINGSSGTLSAGKGTFLVDNNGVVTASDIKISGINSYIDGITIKNCNITDGMTLGGKAVSRKSISYVQSIDNFEIVGWAGQRCLTGISGSRANVISGVTDSVLGGVSTTSTSVVSGVSYSSHFVSIPNYYRITYTTASITTLSTSPEISTKEIDLFKNQTDMFSSKLDGSI